YMLVFVAAILGILWLFQVAFLDKFYEYIKYSEVKDATKTLSQNITSDNFENQVGAFSYDRGICFEIIDSDGNVLYSEDSMPFCTIHKTTHEEKAKLYESVVLNGGTAATFFETTRAVDLFNQPEPPQDNSNKVFQNGEYKEKDTSIQNQGDFFKKPEINIFGKDGKQRNEGYNHVKNLVYSQIVEVDGENLLIVTNTAITPLGATSRILMVQLIFICVILVILSALLSFVLYRKISRPIMQTNEKAKELALSNYDVTFENDEYNEISQLNETLSYAASELKKTETLQRELLSNISHDLRTPLTMITGYAEVMRDIPGENSPENVQVIIDESNRLSDLVTDILDISKLQADVTRLNKTSFSLTKNIGETLNRYKKLVEQGGYVIKFEKDCEVFVNADSIKLSQVIYNLVNNAINHCGQEKMILIKQTTTEKKVRIDVIDYGEGIEEKNIANIWNRYYRVDKKLKREAIGTGLGLSIVQNILKMHKAEYGVTSKYGEGSDFWFELEREN
ncbi:MAG: sensor histidine kinase, partial [Anaerotignaceae bacterium]